MTIHVTDTQKLIATVALSTAGIPVGHPDDPLVADFVRAMLVIEKGGMQSYILNGFNWSCRSRGQHRRQVLEELAELEQATEFFHQGIDTAHGEGARRIRGNRVRRIKEVERQAEHLQLQADLMRLEAGERRMGNRRRRIEAWMQEQDRLPAIAAE